MIFLASQADASALNLGKVSIKTINDVSQETHDVIAAYGNKSFTDSQIIAIDDFLIQLKNLPTYNKFSYCVLPILAPETTFLNDKSPWKDTNPCYDIINKVRLTPTGYDGYVSKQGITKGSSYGNPPTIQLKTALSINPSIFTLGIGGRNNQSSIGYIMDVGVNTNRRPSVQFGAAGKAMTVTCDVVIPEGIPFVAIGSRNATEVHAVMNGNVGVYTGEIKEPYATNPYTLKNAAAIKYYNDRLQGCYFTFFCKDYMMTEEELLKVNNIFYDLVVALW